MQSLMTPYTDLPYYPGVSFTLQPLTGSISYAPLSAFMFGLTYRAYLLLGAPSRFAYYFLLKQPIIFSDVLTGVVLAKIILITKGSSSARFGFLLWLYLPLSILASSVWGALDPIALLLTLLAIYYMLRSQRTASACLLGLAIFLKTMPIIALPVLVMSIKTGIDKRFRYGLVSMAIPTLGTIVPLLLLNWRVDSLFNNLAFQADIPSVGGSLGEMSILGRLLYSYSPSAQLNAVVGLFWIPTLLLAYWYIARRRVSLLQGVLVIVLAFSIARPFLSEQWALYPLALLLAMINQKNVGHLIGLSISATAYLVFNNMLLVRFLAPISPVFANWNIYGTSSFSQSAIADTLLVFAGLFFIEALMTILEKESILYSIARGVSDRLRINMPERAWTIRCRSNSRTSSGN